MMNVETLQKAARVPEDMVPWGRHKKMNAHRIDGNTFLFDAHSLAGIHRLDMPSEGYGGYTVMDDSPKEIARHFQAVRHARGRVLKTGLGLGCFVRMCLTRPDIEHIDVIEIDPDIAAHFGRPFADNPRVSIHVADALEWPIPKDARWDFAWHDIYCDGNDGLELLHGRLLTRFMPHCELQGAWGLPRFVRRLSDIII